MPVKQRTPMPMQDPKERSKNFSQVATGYTEEMALAEASRCLQCKNPLCVSGCPVSVQIPTFIGFLKQKKYREAIDAIKATNNLPAICGRVCPQESQCEAKCVLVKTGQPIAIGRLERFAADWEGQNGTATPEKAPSLGKKVAVVGAGPSGLTQQATSLARATTSPYSNRCTLRAEAYLRNPRVSSSQRRRQARS